MRWLLAAMLIAYAVPLLICSAAAALKHGVLVDLALCLVFPLLHTSHGLGFLKGLFDLLLRRRDSRRVAEQTQLTR